MHFKRTLYRDCSLFLDTDLTYLLSLGRRNANALSQVLIPTQTTWYSGSSSHGDFYSPNAGISTCPGAQREKTPYPLRLFSGSRIQTGVSVCHHESPDTQASDWFPGLRSRPHPTCPQPATKGYTLTGPLWERAGQ